MVKKILFIVMFFINCFIKSQCVLPNFSLQTDELYCYNLIDITLFENKLNYGTYYFIRIDVYSFNGSILLTASTKEFQFNEHYKRLDQTKVKLKINFLNYEFMRMLKEKGGLLPYGEYKIIYYIYKTEVNCDWVGILECKDEYVLNIMCEKFINLIYPFNNDTLNSSKNVIFKWHSVNRNLIDRYYIKIVECYKWQTPEIAIKENTGIYEGYVNEEYLIYPEYARELKEGKNYAWMVKAVGKGNCLPYSEVYVFYMSSTFKKDTIYDLTNFYIEADDSVSHNKWYLIVEDILYFSLSSLNSKEYVIKYLIEEAGPDRRVLMSSFTHPIFTRYGKNYYGIDIGKLNKGKYILRIIDRERNECFVNFIRK